MRFKSLAELLASRNEEDHERLFLSSPEEQVKLTYGAFYDAANQLAVRFQTAGLLLGQRAAVMLENGADWVGSFGALMLIGCTVVPVNPQLSPTETLDLLERSEAQFVITTSDLRNMLSLVLQSGETQWKSIETRGLEATLFCLVKEPQAHKHDCIPKQIGEKHEALLLFTSGSTGRPKGVVLTHENLLTEAEFVRHGHQLSRTDTVLCVLPFFHINGLVITLITTLLSGGQAVVPHKFSASRFWHWMETYHITWFSAVPTILSILLSTQGERNRTPYLRFARSASSSLSAAVLIAFEKRFGVPVIEAYGLSEAASQVASNPLPPAQRKIGSVGLPVGNLIRIVDERGNVLPPGVAGEVAVQGPNVATGYFNNLAANRESFRDNWFYTGDLGYFDQDGYLFLTGRRKELINRAGEKISPREVDEVLYRLPEIETAAAIGVPDDLFGEEVVAVIQLRPGMRLGSDKVIKHCKACLAEFKTPKHILFVDDFPKGPNGKIQRLRLVELYRRLTHEKQAGIGC